MPKRRWLVCAVLALAYVLMLIVACAVILVLIFGDWQSDGFFSQVMDLLEESDSWMFLGTASSIAAALQVIFLIPMFQKQPPRGVRSKSLNVSLALGAIIAALLVTGLALSLTDLLSLIYPEQFDLNEKPPILIVFVGVALVVSWGFWTICLLVFTRGIWADRVLGRLVGLLIAGTALELLVLLPIDLMVRRRTDCYCATGSFFSLSLAAALALWLAGPGIAIAVMAKKQRRWRLTHCGVCGYPMGPTPGEACSECGHAWKQTKQEKKGG